MDEIDTKATIRLIGELWPSTLSEQWGWGKEAWNALADSIRRIPVTAEQARHCLRQLWREGSDGKPNTRTLLGRLHGLLAAQRGDVAATARTWEHVRRIREYLSNAPDELRRLAREWAAMDRRFSHWMPAWYLQVGDSTRGQWPVKFLEWAESRLARGAA